MPDPKPMPELSDFKEAVAETLGLLVAIRRHLPEDISEDVLTYLGKVQDDPAGLRLLRSALHKSG
jgi:hypothetical protein